MGTTVKSIITFIINRFTNTPLVNKTYPVLTDLVKDEKKTIVDKTTLNIKETTQHIDSWKNKGVFEDQLTLNEKELNSYPEHWKLFINAVLSLVGINRSSLLDIGCGVGTYKEICKRHIPAISYTGMDYSQDAIDIAQKRWGGSNWRVGNYKTLTHEDAMKYDILHTGAMLDVLPNGDEALSFLLGLGFEKIILGRVKLTEKTSNYIEYKAYNKIQTYAYSHNIESLVNMSKDFGYAINFKGEINNSTIVLNKIHPITLGSPPCTLDELKSALLDFAKLYKKRPIHDNTGGMKAPQMFAAWFMAKKLQPTAIIESGVWFGQGTWFLEQACPNAKIICIEPELERISYRSNTATYTKTDFSKIDWEKKLDCATTLCFFDDHQNALERLKVATPQGFKHLMFEDNYPVTRGDCVSLKTILEEGGAESVIAKKYLESYYEFPPPVKGDLTRWGDPWTNDVYPTHEPLITDQPVGYEDYFDGYENYTWICYAKVSNK